MALNETAAPLKIPASFKGQFTGIVMKTWHPAALEVGGACVHIDDEWLTKWLKWFQKQIFHKSVKIIKFLTITVGTYI